MSNFAKYTAISDESHGEFFTNLVSKDFTVVEDSKVLTHRFSEHFTITYVEHDEKNRKVVLDYYRNYLKELFFKVEQRASELVMGVIIPNGFFDAVVENAVELSAKAMSGHPAYVDYLLQKEPAEVTDHGPTIIIIRTSVGIVKPDEESENDKVPRLFATVHSEVWQVNKENPNLIDLVGTIDEIEFK